MEFGITGESQVIGFNTFGFAVIEIRLIVIWESADMCVQAACATKEKGLQMPILAGVFLFL